MSTEARRVCIVFVSYNCGGDIVSLITRLKQRAIAGYDIEYVVVDNASADDSVLQLQTIVGPDVTLVPSTENLGFGRGCNLGFEHCQDADLVLLMNPDVEVFDDSVENLLRCSQQHPQAGIWGGVTLDHDRRPDGANAWREPTLMHSLAWATYADQVIMKVTGTSVAAYPKRLAEQTTPYAVDAVSGCFLLIERPLLDRLGGFDERFFMYSEEIDLCRRARELGARPTVCPAATLVHEGSATVTSINRLRFMQRSRLQYFQKHRGRAGSLAAWVLAYLGVMVRVVGFGLSSLINASSKAKLNLWRAIALDRSIWRPLPGVGEA